ncbi:MAG: hypothetical protein AAFY88_13645, partial [Acidobacteriota bacterium]
MKSITTAVFAILTLPAALLAQFQPGYARPGFDIRVSAAVAFDDGDGEALYVGGVFSVADGVAVDGIARWDGEAWTPVGEVGDPAVDTEVLALAVFDDGSGPALYAGGEFTEIAGQPIEGIARWDGSSWSAVGEELSIVNALEIYDDGTGPALYAGARRGLVRWDGVEWIDEVPTPFSSENVFALSVYDDGGGDKLFFGGNFVVTEEIHIVSIGSWDGTTPEALVGPFGDGVNRANGARGNVYALETYDAGDGERLYVGGIFDLAGGLMITDLATWDGSVWGAEASDPPGRFVNALAVYDRDGTGARMAIGGDPDLPANGSGGTVSSWDGATFETLSSATADAVPTATGSLDQFVSALVEFDDGSGPALYAFGRFNNDGVTTAARVARWDGASWSGVSKGDLAGLTVNSTILALEGLDVGGVEGLYAGGALASIGSVANASVAAWTGSDWTALRGAGTVAPVLTRALEAYDQPEGPRLIAAGQVQGQGSSGLASWDGASWTPIGDGGAFALFSGTVTTMEAHDFGTGPELFVAGNFTAIDGQTMNRIASWDGQMFSSLGPAGDVGVNGTVNVAAVFDDGNGPALYVGGNFTEAGGVSSPYLARWDSNTWSAPSLEAP